MRTVYEYSAADLECDANGHPICIKHKHAFRVGRQSWESDSCYANRVATQKAQLKSCMAFFKSLAKNTKDATVKAHVLQALREDEETLKTFNQEKTISCSVM